MGRGLADGPGRAVPVFDQSLTEAIVAPNADSPYIVGGARTGLHPDSVLGGLEVKAQLLPVLLAGTVRIRIDPAGGCQDLARMDRVVGIQGEGRYPT